MSAVENMNAAASVLRTHDRDRYLSALFAARPARAGLMALHAFNCELDRIPALVSEPMLGEIRLQWWRDILDSAPAVAPTGNPLADGLCEAVRDYDLSVARLTGMIDARSADLDGGGFTDLQALRAYFLKTQGAVFALGAQCAGVPSGETARASEAAAVAYGMVQVLFRLPRDAAGGRVMLPLSEMARHGVSPEDVLAGTHSPGLAALIGELTAEARSALGKAREETVRLPRGARPVFAPLALVERVLRGVEDARHDPLHDVVEINPLLRFVTLWQASRSGRV